MLRKVAGKVAVASLGTTCPSTGSEPFASLRVNEVATVKNSIRLHKHMYGLAVWLAAASLLAAPMLWAIPFSQTKMIIEVNKTDGDAGIQFFVDGPGWTRIEIFDPNGARIFESIASGSVGIQGGTELFLESAEPSFDEQSLEELFDLFPAGMYTFSGVTTDGQTLSGKAKFTHNIPDAPQLLAPAEDATVNAAAPVVIRWQAVQSPFPGTTLPVTIAGYQVIVERVKPGPLRVFSVQVPASVTQVTVSPEFLQAKAEYKFEVLAIEAAGNQTISESSFKTQ